MIQLKIGIVGNRTFPHDDIPLVDRVVDGLSPGTTVISGGATRVNCRALEHAERRGLPTVLILPDYNQFGSEAGYIRNKEIVNKSDILIAFWDGKHRGTLHIIKRAEQAGKLVLVVRPMGHYQREMENA